MPSTVIDREYGPYKPKPAPKTTTPPVPNWRQTQWAARYEPYNPFGPNRVARNDTANGTTPARQTWSPFQTTANILNWANNNPYNPFPGTQASPNNILNWANNNPYNPFPGPYNPFPGTQVPTSPQNSTRTPFTGRSSFAGFQPQPGFTLTGPALSPSYWYSTTYPYGASTAGVEAMTNALDWNALRAQDVADWKAAGGTNIPLTDWFDPYDPAGSPYMTSQYVNAPTHSPSMGGGWSGWGGAGGGGGGSGSSAAFYQGNYTQQRARWNGTLLTWGLRQQ